MSNEYKNTMHCQSKAQSGTLAARSARSANSKWFGIFYCKANNCAHAKLKKVLLLRNCLFVDFDEKGLIPAMTKP